MYRRLFSLVLVVPFVFAVTGIADAEIVEILGVKFPKETVKMGNVPNE